MPALPDPLLRALSRQLGGPSGPVGVLLSRMLNRGNAVAIRGAVEALGLTGTETVADVGFGGGLGLDLLLEATQDGGRVHGVDPAPTMVARAGRTRRAEVAAGRLELHEATMSSLPFGDGALDGWISVNTIYFVDDLAAALTELTRVLAPGGRAVVGIADPASMAKEPFTKHGFELRPVDDVLAAMEAAGLPAEDHRLGDDESAFHLLVGRRP